MFRDLKRFKNKINAILKKGASFILLQDSRIGKHIEILKNELKVCKFGNYDIYCNSDRGERGVVTLIRKCLPYKIHNIFKSNDQNVLIIKLSINDSVFLLCNTYAPVQRLNKNFFTQIKQKIQSIGVKNFILCGDLNSLTCSLPIINNSCISNPEVINTSSIPNPIHTNILCSWINDNFSVDVFRIFNPNLKIFSYIPFNKNASNRSRIDHSLCNPSFISSITQIHRIPKSSFKLF